MSKRIRYRLFYYKTGEILWYTFNENLAIDVMIDSGKDENGFPIISYQWEEWSPNEISN
ncbi:hypothetical protein [Gottfriedia luciferensis]|uniref:hypothetical protein n=1 Tax=Gottfriedia luciferensis TaxID=178774 RepID=UPI001586A530|nr:hypothetical protein [Gottfriedia luciferensis]